MKVYSFEELLEEDYGKVGTPEHDAFERSVDEAVHAYRVGEAIKKARESQNLTQAELGEKMGVQRAQVCRLESGKSITLASMMRAFRALGSTSGIGDERHRKGCAVINIHKIDLSSENQGLSFEAALSYFKCLGAKQEIL